MKLTRLQALCVIAAALIALLLIIRACHPARGVSTSAVEDRTTGVREACRQFVERAMAVSGTAEWGDLSRWTVIDNHDGTLTVGARYLAPSATGGLAERYSTCVIRADGRTFQLEKLTRLQ